MPLLEEAARRCDLTFESYLYPAGCTHLALTLPIEQIAWSGWLYFSMVILVPLHSAYRRRKMEPKEEGRSRN